MVVVVVVVVFIVAILVIAVAVVIDVEIFSPTRPLSGLCRIPPPALRVATSGALSIVTGMSSLPPFPATGGDNPTYNFKHPIVIGISR